MITQRLLDEMEVNAQIIADKMLADIMALHLGERAMTPPPIEVPPAPTAGLPPAPPVMPPGAPNAQA